MRELREFSVLLGRSGQLPVVLGSGLARHLHELSFADVLDDLRETGYQRPCDVAHARAFATYINSQGATTIPLTFNLRGSSGWQLVREENGFVGRLRVEVPRAGGQPVMAQVDGQHRLAEMADSDVYLSFQCFLGLSPLEELAIFSTINSKARGLSPALLDFHHIKLAPSAEDVRLELYIAKTLNDDPLSVWCGKVKLGGVHTQGTHRRVSLRGLQTAIAGLLRRCPLRLTTTLTPYEKYEVVREFWAAVAETWPRAWTHEREHLLVKGVGVTAMCRVGGDVISAAVRQNARLRKTTFLSYLAAAADIDWANDGPFKAFGGRHGADTVHAMVAAKLPTHPLPQRVAG